MRTPAPVTRRVRTYPRLSAGNCERTVVGRAGARRRAGRASSPSRRARLGGSGAYPGTSARAPSSPRRPRRSPRALRRSAPRRPGTRTSPRRRAPPNSAKVIAYIDSHGGTAIHPDFGSPREYGFPYAVVGAGAKQLPIHYTAYGSESSPGPFPIPAGAPVEGGAHAEGDRHVLVVDKLHLQALRALRRPLRGDPEAPLGRRRGRRMGPPLGRPAPRRLDLRRRRRPADLPRPRPLRRSRRGPRRPRDPGHHGQHPQRLDPPRLPLRRRHRLRRRAADGPAAAAQGRLPGRQDGPGRRARSRWR